MICAKVNQSELNTLVKDPTFTTMVNAKQDDTDPEDKAINIIPVKDITNTKDVNNMLDNIKQFMIKETKKKVDKITKLNPNEWKASNRT